MSYADTALASSDLIQVVITKLWLVDTFKLFSNIQGVFFKTIFYLKHSHKYEISILTPLTTVWSFQFSFPNIKKKKYVLIRSALENPILDGGISRPAESSLITAFVWDTRAIGPKPLPHEQGQHHLSDFHLWPRISVARPDEICKHVTLIRAYFISDLIEGGAALSEYTLVEKS